MGRSCSIQRNPMDAQEENADSTQRGPSQDSNQVLLTVSKSATYSATMHPISRTFLQESSETKKNKKKKAQHGTMWFSC